MSRRPCEKFFSGCSACPEGKGFAHCSCSYLLFKLGGHSDFPQLTPSPLCTLCLSLSLRKPAPAQSTLTASITPQRGLPWGCEPSGSLLPLMHLYRRLAFFFLSCYLHLKYNPENRNPTGLVWVSFLSFSGKREQGLTVSLAPDTVGER